jgi:hypothetical protein
MAEQIAGYWQNFIDGEFVDGGAGRLVVDDPATGEALAEQALADAGDVDRAVAAARACHVSGALSSLRPAERGRMVRAMGDYLLAHQDRRDRACPDAGKRQAALGSAHRGRGRGALLRVLRQPGRDRRRPVDPAGRWLFRFHRARALWRLGADHPLELSAGDDRKIAVGSLGHRQCLRGQDT